MPVRRSYESLRVEFTTEQAQPRLDENINQSLNRNVVAYALADPEYDQYTGSMARYLLNRLGEPAYLDALAAIHLRRGALDDAERLLRVSERMNPSSHPMLYNMARLFVMRGDTMQARKYYLRLQSAVRAGEGEVDS